MPDRSAGSFLSEHETQKAKAPLDDQHQPWDKAADPPAGGDRVLDGEC